MTQRYNRTNQVRNAIRGHSLTTLTRRGT